MRIIRLIKKYKYIRALFKHQKLPNKCVWHLYGFNWRHMKTCCSNPFRVCTRGPNTPKIVTHSMATDYVSHILSDDILSSADKRLCCNAEKKTVFTETNQVLCFYFYSRITFANHMQPSASAFQLFIAWAIKFGALTNKNGVAEAGEANEHQDTETRALSRLFLEHLAILVVGNFFCLWKTSSKFYLPWNYSHRHCTLDYHSIKLIHSNHIEINSSSSKCILSYF